MIRIAQKANCCGCEACVQICPKRCIAFSEDEEGFMYPSADESLCIDCGLCEKTCPVINSSESVQPLQVYAAKNKSEEERSLSSSGGVFAALAKKTLGEGGVVFGATLSSDFLSVKHVYVEKEDELPALMGSKYVQSRIGNSFQQAKSFLESGRKVMFCGTGCQNMALRSFLRKEYDNLLTVDFICHGVPSPKVWRQHLGEITSDGDKIESISFRDKRTGWSHYSFTLDYVRSATGENKQITRPYETDPYMWLYLNDYTLRPSCHACPARKGKSHSDLTLGDFWGIETAHPECYDERGVSSLFVNSEKGKNFLAGLKLDLQTSSLASATAENPPYFVSKKEQKGKAQFFNKYNSGKYTLEELARIYRRKKAIVGIPVWIKRKLRAVKKRLL